MATKKNTAIRRGDKTYDYYRITRTIGHEWKDGKRVPIKKQFVGSSKGNAEQKYEAWKEEQRANKEKNYIDSSKPFGELADYYAKNILAIQSKYAHSTKERYMGAFEQFKKKDATGLLGKAIQSVSAADIQIAYNQIDVPLSTMQTIHKFFSGFFKWGTLNRYCSNILSAVTIPDKPIHKNKGGIVIWSEDEQSKIVSCLGAYRLRFLVILLLYTGLRISEALGVKYSDIDGHVLSVERQYYRGDLVQPKYNSRRKIPCHQLVLRELELHKAWHEKEMATNGYTTEYIFTTTGGVMLDYTNVKRSLRRFYARNDIPYKSTHTYRATFCTNLCMAGVPLQVAAQLMGHKSVEVTAQFYTFISESEKASAIDSLPDFAVSKL